MQREITTPGPLLDAQGHFLQVDLLHDVRPEAGGTQVPSAIGAAVQPVVEDGLDLLGREQGPLGRFAGQRAGPWAA